VAERWDSIEVVSVKKEIPELQDTFESGKSYSVEYVIDQKGLDDVLGIEMVLVSMKKDGTEKLQKTFQLELVKREENLFTFRGKIKNDFPGVFKVAYRIYPKNIDLPHRQDFCYVKWVD